MTSIQQNWFNYLETVKHNRAMEQQGQQELAVSKYKAETERKRQEQDAAYSAAQIKQIANSIRQKDIELKMTGDMNNWKQEVDKFNQDLATQKQSLENSRLEFDKEKFNQGQDNWWKEYDLQKGNYTLAKKNYDLALAKFKNDKTQATWSNVVQTAKAAADIINSLTKSRSIAMDDFAKLAAKAAAK